MITPQEFEALKREADRANREVNRLQGVYDRMMAELKEKWGCATLKAAERLLETHNQNLEKLEEEFMKLYKEFKDGDAGRLG